MRLPRPSPPKKTAPAQRVKPGHYIVCGGGETGGLILQELVQTGRPCVLVEQAAARVETLRSRFPGLEAVVGDATDERCLQQAGLAQAAGLVAALPDEKDNLQILLSVDRGRTAAGPDFRLVARVNEANRTAVKFSTLGAVVVSPADLAGRRLAEEMLQPAPAGFFDRLGQDGGEAVVRLEEVVVEPQSSLAYQTLGQAQIPHKIGLIIIAIKKQNQSAFICNPAADRILDPGDVLITVGDIRRIIKLRQLAARPRHA